MILVGIDIGKNQHTFSIIDKGTGEILSNPSVFNNNQEGFLSLIKKLSDYAKSELLIGMEDTGHYHFALLKYLLDSHYTVALINPATCYHFLTAFHNETPFIAYTSLIASNGHT